MGVNLSLLEKIAADGKRATAYATSLKKQLKTAEGEFKAYGEAGTNGRPFGYFYLKALLGSCAWDSPEFWKYVCPSAAVKELLDKCLAFVESQEAAIEAEVQKQLRDMMEVEDVGAKKNKKSQ